MPVALQLTMLLLRHCSPTMLHLLNTVRLPPTTPLLALPLTVEIGNLEDTLLYKNCTMLTNAAIPPAFCALSRKCSRIAD